MKKLFHPEPNQAMAQQAQDQGDARVLENALVGLQYQLSQSEFGA